MVNARDIKIGSKVKVLDPSLICFGEDLDLDQDGFVEVMAYDSCGLWLRVREDTWGYPPEGLRAIQVLAHELEAIAVGVYYG